MRHICFISFSLLALALYFKPIKELAGLSFHNPLYSHFLLIPLVCLYFFVLDRKTIFAETGYSFQIGLPVVTAGLLFYWFGKSHLTELNQNDYLSLMMFSFLIFFIGSFIVFYDIRAFRKALFPLLFMIFIVPIPSMILEPLIRILVIASANTAYAVFNILDVPVFRDGFIFELPGISVEVAKECSGIRSSLALFITSVAAGHLFLQTGWRRIVLSLSIFPITIFKNALRIVTISLLAAYVDPVFLTNHWIHRAGGKPFFIFSLLVLLPVLLLLRRSEKKREQIEGGTLSTYKLIIKSIL
jgi:exosortase